MKDVSDLANEVRVHPLVLLSVVDHFRRVNTKKRVVGILLGQKYSDHINISNSFAVPFDEDKHFYLDHDYVLTMFQMFKKINAKELIVGWYHTGPQLHFNDLEIHRWMQHICGNGVLCIIQPFLDHPIDAYTLVDNSQFQHISSSITSEQSEEIGVEHLLRDIFELQKSPVQLDGLKSRVDKIINYLELVQNGKMPLQQDILDSVQELLQMRYTVPGDVKHETHDQLLLVFVASMSRSVIALHELIDNKLGNMVIHK
eukprot:NODE_69_length_23719_cov_0.556689.p9 type:complete len:257 gc:universal NODE_69_length_23719_cov_0.556689:14118-14888(+)